MRTHSSIGPTSSIPTYSMRAPARSDAVMMANGVELTFNRSSAAGGASESLYLSEGLATLGFVCSRDLL